MTEKKEKIGGKMIRKKKVLAIVIGFLIFIVLAGGILGYLVYTGRLDFKADTSTTVISNTIYGSYSSDQGTGNISSNEVQVQVTP